MKFSQTSMLSILALANTAISLPTADLATAPHDPMALSHGKISRCRGESTCPELACKHDSCKRSTNLICEYEKPALQKCVPPFIALGKILLGQALAGVAKAGVDAAKAHLEDKMIPENDHDNLDAARDYFMRNAPKDIFDNRAPGVVGIACINGPYTLSDNTKCAVAFNLEFKWDMYYTDYECMEMYPGSSVVKHGDGGYMNVGYYGSCKFEAKTYTC
ncbi:hypothetical protein CBER1_11173 [Cercospora berteroae]|uniref:DUF7888 domain-containing protein n=1 Tax=Cercospora berteroae TaxID=357750 RepID=A0A2S6CEH0_9PEZI|nr:hypothetical protein CBER1_11173 [Cercospora berteroae]